jgi:hypothetical protein
MIGSEAVLLEDLKSGKYYKDKEKAAEAKLAPPDGKTSDTPKSKPKVVNAAAIVDLEKGEHEELKNWRKVVYKCIDFGEKIDGSRFKTRSLDDETRDTIIEGLKGVHSKHQAKLLFDQFLDPTVRTSMELLAISRKMREINNADFTDSYPEN